jgi:tRNA(His) 5'-end guanylyltransferase
MITETKILKGDSLGDRMKGYEMAFRFVLPKRMPLIIRLDGRSWHTYTQHLTKPLDTNLINAMDQVAIKLCQEIDGVVLAYVQSDEISILIHNYKTLQTQAWFDNQVQKLCSISASIAAAKMTALSHSIFGEIKEAHFDSRCFILPESEVCNYFLWRQRDASRNSVQMLARSLASYKECENKNNAELQELIIQKDQNWNNWLTSYRRGRCVIKKEFEKDDVVRHAWEIDNEIPIFSQNREYIEKNLKILED